MSNNINLSYTTEPKTEEALKKAWDAAKPATDEIQVEYKTETGETKKQTLNMSEGLRTSFDFWRNQPLPAVPEIFIPNSETKTPAASDLEEPVQN